MFLENTGYCFSGDPLKGMKTQADLQTQGRQCTYNVRLRCIRATVVAVEKQ